MATLNEQIARAVRDRDLKGLLQLVEHMRFTLGWRAGRITRTALRAVPGLTVVEWDELVRRDSSEQDHSEVRGPGEAQ